jgi:hypothetical protein
MRKGLLYVASLVCGCLFTGCDDGNIYPPEREEAGGPKVTMQVSFTGLEAWPVNYSLIFAAFGEDGKHPVMSKIISRPASGNEQVTVSLSGLDERVRTIGIAVANKGREQVYSCYSYTYNGEQELLLPVSEINLAAFGRVQQQVFDSYCTRCHGEGEQAAASMYLTADRSYRSIVNVPSSLSAAKKLLIHPGLPAESFMIDILTTDIVRYNHTDVLPEAEMITLIETWIKDGAEE